MDEFLVDVFFSFLISLGITNMQIQLTLEQPQGLGALIPCTFRDFCITFDSLKTELSLSIRQVLVPEPPMDTKTHGCSSPLYKIS